MSDLLTFSQCLHKLMHEHHLNATSLSSLLGSRTLLKRLLNDEASAAKREEAFQKLANAGLFSQDDLSLLSEALEVSRVGIVSYQFQQAIRYVLTGKKNSSSVFPIKTDNGIALTERLDDLKSAEKIDIICINSCFHALFTALLPFFSLESQKIHFEHYIHADTYANTAANFVAVVYPLLFDKRYEPYGIIRTSTAPHYLGGNILSIRAAFENEIKEYFFIINNDECAYEMPKAQAGEMHAYIRTLIQSLSPAPYTLKESIGIQGDFASLCMGHLSHELNRTTCCISSDLLLHQVPTDIAIAALREKQAFPDDVTEQIVEKNRSIHEQRYQNQCTKRKPSYHVMSISGCKRFLKTGKNTDHFFGFREFTPGERKRIFGEMLLQARENPYFIPFLIKEESYENLFTLVCYDKLGVSVDASTTNYSWDMQNHSIFLTYPEFTQQFHDFFMQTIVQDKCFSEEKSLELLEEMFCDFLKENNLNND